MGEVDLGMMINGKDGLGAVQRVTGDRIRLIRYVFLYTIEFLILSTFMYYYPEYSILESMTAEHAAGVLNAMGILANSIIVKNGAYVNNVQIVRECTGIQVIAVFVGLLLPLPKISWSVKLKAITVLGFAVYIANVIRVAFELWLLYAGILPWSISHGPVGTILGVITVFIFFLVVDRFIPQIGVFLAHLADWMISKTQSLKANVTQNPPRRQE
jgi:exosortase/archaeosortase family protein